MTGHDDAYQLQRLLDRRSFLELSSVGVAALLAFPAGSAAAASPDTHPRGARRSLRGASVYHPPYALDADCVLSEDHFLVQLAQISADDEVVAYSWANGDVEAMLLQDGAISQVYRDAHAPGGWNSRAVVAAGATDMVAGMAADNGGNLALHVFYRTTAGAVIHLRQLPTSGAPGPLTLTDTFNWGPGGLQITTDPLQNLLVSCVTPSSAAGTRDAKLWFYYTGSNGGLFSGLGNGLTYGVLSGFEFDSTLGDAQLSGCAIVSYAASVFHLAPTVMLYAPQPTGTSISVYQYTMPDGGQINVDANLTGFAHQPPAEPGAAEIVSVDYLSSPNMFNLPTAVVRTVDQNLYTLTHDYLNNVWYWQQLTLPPSTGSASQQPGALRWEPSNRQVMPIQLDNLALTNNLLNLFVVTDATLSVVRQVQQSNPTQDAVTPIFNPAVPLQGQVAATASQARPSPGDELIVAGDDGNLQVLTKSATGNWTTSEIHLPATEPAQISTYRVQLQLTDTWDTPVANQTLSITSSLPATALVNGQGIAVSSTPVTVTTDGSGHAMVAIIADGLFAPNLTVTASQLPAPVIVSPSAAVNAYMSGTTTLNLLPNLDANALANATTSSNSPVAPVAKADSSAATAAVSVLAGAAKAATNPGSPTLAAHGLGRQQRPATRYDRATSHGTASRAGDTRPGGHTTRGAADRPSRHHPALRLGSAPERLGGTVEVGGLALSFSDLADDALYAIKTGAAKVSQVVIAWDNDLKQWVAQLTAKFEAWASQALNVTIAGLEDAAHVFHSVINHLEALLGDFINWLEAKILTLLRDTVTVAGLYDGWLLQLTDTLTQLDQQAKDATTGFFGQQKTVIAGDLANLKKQVGSQSLSQIGQAQGAADSTWSAHAPQRLGASTASSTPDAHARWLLDKLGQSRVTATPPSVTADLHQLINDVATKFDQAGGDLKTAANNFREAVGAFVSNPKQFATVGVDKLIDALADLIDAALDLADALTVALLGLLAAAIDAFKSLITTSLSDLPLIGPLLTLAGIKTAPTVTQIVTLLIAFPTVLAYKLAYFDADAIPFQGVTLSRSGRLQGASRTLRGASVAADLNFTTSVATIFWAFTDGISAIITGLAKEGDEPLPDFFTWIDIVTPMVIGCLTFPAHDGGLPFTSAIDTSNPADVFTTLAWVAGITPGLLTSISYYTSQTDNNTVSIAVSDEMLNLTTLSGIAAIMCGITAAAAESNTANDAIIPSAIALLGNISAALATGLTTAAVDASGGGSAVLVGAIGWICGTIAGVLQASAPGQTLNQPAPSFTG